MGALNPRVGTQQGNGAWNWLSRCRGWRNQVRFWQLHRWERATWWVEASRKDPVDPLMPQLMLTDGHRAVGRVRPAHTRKRPKASLASFTLWSQDWEGDQLERPGKLLPGIWSQKNESARVITSCVALGKYFTSLSLIFFICNM